MSVLMVKRSGGVLPWAPAENLDPVKLAQLDAYLEQQLGKANMVIPALQQAQVLFGYVPPRAMQMVASALAVPLARVYGVVTFYAQFRLQPSGRHTVKVCMGTACHVRGAEGVLRAWADALGVHPGETTGDGAITLERVACLGACGLAPTVMVDAATHGRLTVGKVKQVLAKIDRG